MVLGSSRATDQSGSHSPRLQATIEAVAEVGNPTIVATLTVVAALLPMLFVSGLMGPYMAPIPANASAAMLFSFFVAMVIAPWLMLRLHPEGKALHEHEAAHGEGKLGRLYRRFATPILKTRTRAWIFLVGVGVAEEADAAQRSALIQRRPLIARPGRPIGEELAFDPRGRA